MMNPNLLDERNLTRLRRKFLVTIPTLSVVGWFAGRWASTGWGKWARRGTKTGLALLAPVIGCMGIVHFNKHEIYRIGKSTLSHMEELRRQELPPFHDPTVRAEWDKRMDDRKFRLFKSEITQEELNSDVNFLSIVDNSISK
jgi:hypothetical protein